MSRRRKAEVVEGVVRALGRGGDGVLETPVGVWLVPDVLPGERVRARQVSARAGVTRGKLVELLEASPHRVEPECPYQRPCGGCPLMHASPDHERELKRQLLEEALARVGAGNVPVQWHAAERMQRYRTRARLSWERKGARLQLGFRRARSRQVVDIPACLVLGEPLDVAWQALRERLGPALQGQGEVSLALGAGGGVVAMLRTEQPQPPALYAACEAWAAEPGMAGVALRVGEGAQPAVWGEPREELASVDGQPLLGTVGGFSQANARVNLRLVETVRGLADPCDASVLELYAGHGNFSVALAPGSRGYTAVEQDPEAAESCRENLRSRGLSAKVVAGPAEAHLGKGPLDVLVLDPPRSGARGVLASVAPRKPQRIVYVSCDLSTLERDLRELAGGDYRVDHAHGFDMFPRTGQLEAVVRLTR